MSGAVHLMLVMQSKTADGHYRWSIEPRTAKTLEGRPWDAQKQPRMKLKDERKDRSKIPPSVRVELSCRREDLCIEDIRLKDETLWDKIKDRAKLGNNIAAAESYIRERLAEEGLEVQNIEDRFGYLTLYSITATAT
jgi:hypothetical protein